MENKKPSVFPTQKQKDDDFERAKKQVTDEIYSNSAIEPSTNREYSNDYSRALSDMKKRSQNELDITSKDGVVQYKELAEIRTREFVSQEGKSKNDELIEARDRQLKMNQQQIDEYQKQSNKAMYTNTEPYLKENIYASSNVPPTTPPQPPNNYNSDYENNDNNNNNNNMLNQHINQLSQPDFNTTYDVIPLPSQGKLNKGIPRSVKVSYLTTADESILTSPNILNSGRFLEILINRKLLEFGLRYENLHIGDRNALMIWLRATGYGEMYPVTLFDENDKPFDTEINLNELKIKNLAIDPDSEGLFTYQFPLCKAVVKFKLLTCGDIDLIDKKVEKDKENESPINKSNVYMMEQSIVEVNGDRDKSVVSNFANSIRIGDTKAFNKYVEEIESGVDLNIEVRTPGGGSIKTFLPLNINFFWPDIRL